MTQQTDEFYVGYLATAPASLAKRTRRVALALVLGAAVVSLVLVLAHQRLPLSVFEYGETRTLDGTIVEKPYPALIVDRPGRQGELTAVSEYLLVSPGKHGADEAVSGLDGTRVRLRGSLIYRDGRTAVEIVPGSIEDRGRAPKRPGRVTDFGTVTLVGEIVDSKCFLGVMNPGNAKTHRDCAVRCISGGAPPLFVVRDADGRSVSVLLVGADRRSINREILDYVAEPIEITGQLDRESGVLLLRAEPNTYVRVR